MEKVWENKLCEPGQLMEELHTACDCCRPTQNPDKTWNIPLRVFYDYVNQVLTLRMPDDGDMAMIDSVVAAHVPIITDPPAVDVTPAP